MKLPRFLLGDHAEHPEDIFVLHLEYPRFVINLKDDEVELLEDVKQSEQKELEEDLPNLIEEASRFYDEQIKLYQE